MLENYRKKKRNEKPLQLLFEIDFHISFTVYMSSQMDKSTNFIK